MRQLGMRNPLQILGIAKVEPRVVQNILLSMCLLSPAI